MKPQFNIFLLCLLWVTASSQLRFTQVPVDMQMIPRGKGKVGQFQVTGYSLSKDIVSIKACIFSNDTTLYSTTTINVLANSLIFSATLAIPAKMEDYDLHFYAITREGKSLLQHQVKNLVAGDYYIVGGQSNAAASADIDTVGIRINAQYSNRYGRSIGILFERCMSSNPFNSLSYTLEDDWRYYQANCIYYYMGNVGIWPLRLMDELMQKTGIPVCVVNGAIGGTDINFHQASNTPSNPEKLQLMTINTGNSRAQAKPYDRVFKKLQVHNVAKHVRGIFWYQGESDGLLTKDSALSYTRRFGKLRRSWKTDYPALEKIFLFQINTGCDGRSIGVIRDQQRKLQNEFADVVVMPTVGSLSDERGKDACHYTPSGYEMLATIMAPVVLKQLYGFVLDDENIMPPLLMNVSYTKPDVICLEFDKNVHAQLSQEYTFQNTGTAYLKDYFYKESGRPIKLKSITTDKTKIYLELSDTLSKISLLTYLPDIFTNIPTTYAGPWIVNEKNHRLGALSFFEAPVIPYGDAKLIQKTYTLDEPKILIYPNPSENNFGIYFKEGEVHSIRLTNTHGETIIERTVLPTETEILMNTEPLENGIYFIGCEKAGVFYTRKILVQKL